jgi:hypothetical protein
MKQRFYLFKRGPVYYLEDSVTGKQASLKTKDRREAVKLVNAKNEAVEFPHLGTALAKAYLSASDPTLVSRTWNVVIERFCAAGRPSTQSRRQRAMKSAAFDCIRDKKLVETREADFRAVLDAGGVFTNHCLRLIHNLALGLGWLAWPVIPPKLWPPAPPKKKRGILWEEHQRIVQSEQNIERRMYYEVLWEIGAAQTDGALLRAEDIDWNTRTLSYQRRKTGEWCHLRIGARLESLLRELPSTGPLFPKISQIPDSARSAEFCRRCGGKNLGGQFAQLSLCVGRAGAGFWISGALGTECTGTQFTSRARGLRKKCHRDLSGT